MLEGSQADFAANVAETKSFQQAEIKDVKLNRLRDGTLIAFGICVSHPKAGYNGVRIGESIYTSKVTDVAEDGGSFRTVNTVWTVTDDSLRHVLL